MNFTLDKKKCIYIVIWLLIGLLSFTVLGKYASAPESHQATIASLDEKKATVLELTAATQAFRASPVKLPTTARSEALKSCPRMAVAAMGRANWGILFQIEPWIISISARFVRDIVPLLQIDKQ